MSVQVELHVGDIDATIATYGAIGFDTLRRGDDWAVIALDGATIKLQSDAYILSHPHYFTGRLDHPRGAGVEIVVETEEDIDAVADRVRPLGVIVKEIQDREWGARDFRIADPDGYFVRVTTPLD